jgi:hypothetical protein
MNPVGIVDQPLFSLDERQCSTDIRHDSLRSVSVDPVAEILQKFFWEVDQAGASFEKLGLPGSGGFF